MGEVEAYVGEGSSDRVYGASLGGYELQGYFPQGMKDDRTFLVMSLV